MIADEIYFCRHGQTDYNAEGRLQGRRDIPLNPFGRLQAKRNGVCLRKTLAASADTYRFIASPLARAQETMRIVRAELRLAPDGFETDERLAELGYGDWEGATLAEIGERDPAAIAARDGDKWNYRSPGRNAESYADLLRRVTPLVELLAERTIVVAHGGISRALLVGLGGVDPIAAASEPIPQDRVLTFTGTGARWL